MASGMDAKAIRGDNAARTALAEVSVQDIRAALKEGKRVSIMIGRSDLEKGDEEAALIGIWHVQRREREIVV